MRRAAKRLGDSNFTPHGCEDDLLVRMTVVWLRNTTAAMLQSCVRFFPGVTDFFQEMDLVKRIRRRLIHYTNAKDLSRLEVMEVTEVVELR